MISFDVITGKTEVLPDPPALIKTPADIKAEIAANSNKIISELQAAMLPEVLNFIASLPGCPQTLKDAAATIAAEKIKVK